MKSKKNIVAGAVFFCSFFFNSQVSASWLFAHGNSGHLEDEAAASTFARKGYGLEVEPQWEESTWVHFSVPANGDKTSGARYVRLDFSVDSALNSQISRVDVYNGNILVKSFTNLNWNTLGFNVKTLNLGGVKRFTRGMGVSVEITAGPDSGTDQFVFHGVGAKFVP
ncbi:MAG: hypothetical protein ACU837_10480 [Gammaproteobacteria bacterium]